MSYKYGTNPDPYPYPIGTLIRYESGPTALGEICHHHTGANGYHIDHCMGGLTFVGHNNIHKASDADFRTWHETAKWRKKP